MASTPSLPARQSHPRASRRWRGSTFHSARAWTFSLLGHAIALLIYWSLWEPLPTGREPRDEVVIQIRLGKPKAPQLPLPSEPKPIETPDTPPAEPLEATVDPRTKTEEKPVTEPSREETPEASAVPPSDPSRLLEELMRAKTIGLGPAPPLEGGSSVLGNRGRGKLHALQRYGGSGATENAVEKGLRWLAAHQDSDGGWDCERFTRHCKHVTPCTGRGSSDNDVGTTALCVLAFLGAGHAAHMDGPYRRNVDRGIDHLMALQDDSGGFGPRGATFFYNHALTCLALSEAYALLGDATSHANSARRRREELAECVVAALEFSGRAQQEGGGWDYSVGSTGRDDLSITGWQIFALRSADQAGLPIPHGTLDATKRFIARAFTPAGQGIYANRGLEAGRRGINMTAVGLLSFLYLGGPVDALRCRLAADEILRKPPQPKVFSDWDRSFQSYYYWYTGTLALFHLGGKRWDAWNHLLKQKILPLQSQEGHSLGSWPPEANWIGSHGGRVYATAINVLTLETYYRYRPLYATRKTSK